MRNSTVKEMIIGDGDVFSVEMYWIQWLWGIGWFSGKRISCSGTLRAERGISIL